MRRCFLKYVFAKSLESSVFGAAVHVFGSRIMCNDSYDLAVESYGTESQI